MMRICFVLAILLVSGWGSSAGAQAPKLAPVNPSGAKAPPRPIAERGRVLLNEAFEKTKGAKTIDDVSNVIEMCERAQGVVLDQPNQAYAHSLLAWAYNRRGEIYAEQAAVLIEKGQDRKANDLDSVALDDFNTALTFDANRWKALHNRGVSLALFGRHAEALADFDKVIELKKDAPKAFFNRAEVYLALNKWDEALADFNQVLGATTGDVDALIGRGKSYYRLKKAREAIADFNQALRFQPTSAVALAWRGEAEILQGQWQTAAEDFRQAIKLNPNLGRAYRGAAWLMATSPEEKLRNVELALSSATKAIALDGKGDFSYLDALAAAQANAGNFEEAKTTLTEAFSQAPADEAEALQARIALYAAGLPYRAATTPQNARVEKPAR